MAGHPPCRDEIRRRYERLACRSFLGGPLIDFGGDFFCWSFHWLADVHFTSLHPFNLHVGSTYAPQRNLPLMASLTILGRAYCFSQPDARNWISWSKWSGGLIAGAVARWMNNMGGEKPHGFLMEKEKRDKFGGELQYILNVYPSHSFRSLHSATLIKGNFSMKEV